MLLRHEGKLKYCPILYRALHRLMYASYILVRLAEAVISTVTWHPSSFGTVHSVSGFVKRS